MSIRGARVLVAGASSPFGQRLVEAFLALGAHVFAADALRTRLDELRARLRQHERLWVAECDFGSLRAAQKLLGDVARDEPLDVAILVLPSTWPRQDPDDAALPASHECFLQSVIEVQAKKCGGRVLFVQADGDSNAGHDGAANSENALAALVADAEPRAALHGIALCGARVDPAHPAVLERMVALCDPEHSTAAGFMRVP